MRYTYKTRFGVFAITPGTNGRWDLWLNDERLGSFSSAMHAADDVLTRHTGHDGWDMAEDDEDAPEGLGEWTCITR